MRAICGSFTGQMRVIYRWFSPGYRRPSGRGAGSQPCRTFNPFSVTTDATKVTRAHPRRDENGRTLEIRSDPAEPCPAVCCQMTLNRTSAPSVSAPGTSGTHTVMIR